MEFKVDDRVRRINGRGWGMLLGDVGTVTSVAITGMNIKRDIKRNRICDVYSYEKDDFAIIPYNQKERDDFVVGDEVECLTGMFCFIDKGVKYRVTCVEDDYILITNKTGKVGCRYSKQYFKPVGKSNQKGETKMSIPKGITDSYKETKDAVLVDKWFGSEISDTSSAFRNSMFRLHKDGILTEAKRLQKEEDATQNK